MPNEITGLVTRNVPLLHASDTVGDAVRTVLDSGLPALPVAADDEHFAGVFGEREFMEALFPGYVGNLRSAGFIGRSMEDVLEKRSTCASERIEQHMNTERVAVEEDFSDVQVAEVFLHHRVLIVPVLSSSQEIIGVVTRGDFFRALADRFLGASGG